jgi:hypothetical protein
MACPEVIVIGLSCTGSRACRSKSTTARPTPVWSTASTDPRNGGLATNSPTWATTAG